MADKVAVMAPPNKTMVAACCKLLYFSLRDSHCNNKPANRKPIGRCTSEGWKWATNSVMEASTNK